VRVSLESKARTTFEPKGNVCRMPMKGGAVQMRPFAFRFMFGEACPCGFVCLGIWAPEPRRSF
jgi:hypothetical protein